ncbi:MAG TPA: hypothetical protein VFB58_09175 [Chloroflexota bacterium]|nr:hypothetical protein [Chloroflexota bacterium]
MAVEMRTELPGATADQAKEFEAHVLPRIKTFPGFIAGAYGLSDAGFFVTEFWESRETHERWIKDFIAPMLQQFGVTAVPPVHYRHVDAVAGREGDGVEQRAGGVQS